MWNLIWNEGKKLQTQGNHRGNTGNFTLTWAWPPWICLKNYNKNTFLNHFSICRWTLRSQWKDASSAPLFKLDLGKEDEIKVIDKVTEEEKKKDDKSVASPRTARSETSEIKTETAAPDTARSETDISKVLDSARSDTTKASEAVQEQPPDSARSGKSAVSVVTEDDDDRSYSYSYSESSSDGYSSSSHSKSKSESTSSSSSSHSTVTQSVTKPGIEETAAKPGYEVLLT